MGTVYVGERADDQSSRVALQSIAEDSRSALVHRFMDERQILASLVHLVSRGSTMAD